MEKLRMRYGKTDKAKYLSHLDLLATMRRALLRANVKLKYSEGFNPHPYMSVALPLPVGCGSECELMDFGGDGACDLDALPESINAALPGGIEVYEIYTPINKFTGIAFIEIFGVMHYDNGAPPRAAERLNERFKSECIIISKRTKRGMSELNIAPFVKDAVFSGEGVVTVTVKLPAQNPTLNPDSIINALEGKYSDLSPLYAAFTRKKIFDSEMNVFR